MQVEIREGGDGVACWNRDAVLSYAATVDEREARIAATNPDVRVTPGLVKCYGCEVLEYDMGTRCTAVLTRTLYAVAEEVGPRTEDAKGSLSEIPDLVSRLDAEPSPQQVDPAPAEESAAAAPRPRGLRGLLGRRS